MLTSNIPAKAGNAYVPNGTTKVRSIKTRLNAPTIPDSDTFNDVFITHLLTTAVSSKTIATAVHTQNTGTDITHRTTHRAVCIIS